MIELDRHIEILLLRNDCVVIPGLGGFVTNHVEARYDEVDQTFLPPFRTLGFNPQLTMNDSLLAQSYVEAYDISYPEALRRIELEVAELRQQIASQGSYTLHNIGTLSLNEDRRYVFEPCEAGIITPSLYGLGAVPFAPLDAAAVATPAKEVAMADTVADEKPDTADEPAPADNSTDETALQIKMSWVRTAVAVAATVAAFFLLATPVANSDLGSNTLSSIQHHMIYQWMPQDTNVAPTASIPKPAADTMRVVAKADTVKTQPKPAAQTAEPATDTYYIVLASQVTQHNAELFVEQLHQLGHSEARVFVHNKTVRVVCGTFQKQADAYQKLNSLRGQKHFEEAWVYKKAANS